MGANIAKRTQLPPRLEAYAGTLAVAIKKDDAATFKRAPHCRKSSASRLGNVPFKLTHADDPDLRLFCEIRLAPLEQTTRSSTLGRGHKNQ